MSPKAKYGWAIGLIVVGVVFALPFRNVQTQDIKKVADGTTKKADVTETENEIVDNKGSLTNSPLMPGHVSPEKQESKKVEGNHRKMIGQFDRSLADSESSPGQIVEEVPNKFRAEDFGSDKFGNERFRGEGLGQDKQLIANNDRGASLRPIDLPNEDIRKTMPESVGPYRMKKVPSGKFMRASQSDNNSGYSSVSRSRRVVHYKLRDGDSLRSIAKRYLGDGERFQEILADNRHILTNGENFLPVGQYITIVVQ